MTIILDFVGQAFTCTPQGRVCRIQRAYNIVMFLHSTGVYLPRKKQYAEPVEA